MSVKRFERLLRVRATLENQAAIGLAARLEELRQAEGYQEQLQQLLYSYLDTGLSGDARTLKQSAKMRAQLRTAMERQELRIAAVYEQVEQARSQWMDRHRDTLSLEKLIERRRQAEQVTENRRLQYEQDAWATRRVFEQRQ